MEIQMKKFYLYLGLILASTGLPISIVTAAFAVTDDLIQCPQCGLSCKGNELISHTTTSHQLPLFEPTAHADTSLYFPFPMPPHDLPDLVTEKYPTTNARPLKTAAYASIEELIQCPQCGLSCKGKKGLTNHISAAHIKNDQPKRRRIKILDEHADSSEAPISFNSAQTNIALPATATFICQICTRSFSTEKGLHCHVTSHRKNAEYLRTLPQQESALPQSVDETQTTQVPLFDESSEFPELFDIYSIKPSSLPSSQL